MRKDLSAIGLGMVLSGIAAFSCLAADPATTKLRGHVPAPVARGKVQSVGDVSTETTIDLSIGLPLRNRGELANLLDQL